MTENRFRWILPVVAAWCLAPVSASEQWDQAREFAAAIDQQIALRWHQAQVVPAPPADDATYLRRVHLDLSGKIPTAWEVREYLADESPDKRERLVDRLIESPLFVSYQAAQWRRILLPEASIDPTARFLAMSFEAWLRREWMQRRTFDETAHTLLTARLSDGGRRPMQSQASPSVYYAVKQGQPEELATSVARSFLGIRLECAQCHDHPFDHWQQTQFWQLAAFFGQLQQDQPEAGVYSPITDRREAPELSIPGTEIRVQPRFPDGDVPMIAANQDARRILAEWLISPANPWFAQATANRVWAQFFGTGLVDPVDDFSAGNPASHPELLDLLSRELVHHRFDLRHLMRAIALTRTYALASRGDSQRTPDPQWFSVAPVRRLSAEQIVSSTLQAIGAPTEGPAYAEPFANDPVSTLQNVFMETGDTTTDASTSIVQALTVMNGGLTVAATHPDTGNTLAAARETPGLTPQQRIEMLYLATVSRAPTDAEMEILLEVYLDDSTSSDTALANIFWSLLNSTEFLTNH